MQFDEHEYEAVGDDYIAVERWGKDHWSTFAYLECCAVDAKGKVDRHLMRCNARLHRELANDHRGTLHDGSQYPTRLKDGELTNHDDWSCVEDMVTAGLVRAFFQQRRATIIANTEARIELTEKGKQIAAALRQWKASGGRFHDFVAPAVAQQEG